MSDARHPRETFTLIGHEDIERQLLEQVKEKRLPGAYLLVGAPGIGKATLAYRLARFLLSGAAEPPVEEGGMFGNALPAAWPSSLATAREHPAVARMLAGSHADFLVLEPEWDDKKKAHKSEIPVEAARRIGGFLSHTAGEGRWRVVVIDPAHALNVNAANAILKWLEEPPRDTLFLLVSDRPGALLPTIRSRCRTLAIAAPDEMAFATILSQSGVALEERERHFYYRLSGGSPGIASQMIGENAESVYCQLLDMVATDSEAAALKFSEKWTFGKDAPSWPTLERLVARLIAALAREGVGAAPDFLNDDEAHAVRRLIARKPLDYWLEVWNKGGALLADAERLYLNRKHALLTVLLCLMGHEVLDTAAG